MDYLRFMALVPLGWMWARMALHTLESGTNVSPLYQAKLAVARFFYARILPQTLGLKVIVANGPATLMDSLADAA